MSNIVKFPTPSQQGSEADDAERAEASFADKRLATIARIEVGIEMRNRAFREGLDHLSRNRVTDFLDALKDGRIDDATEIFDGGAGLAAQIGEPGACDIDTAPTLAEITRFDARPNLVHSISTEATPVVALRGDGKVLSAKKRGFEVEHGKLDLAAGHAARLSSGYASLTLLLHQGVLFVEDAQGVSLARTVAWPQTCVVVQIEAAAGCLDDLIFRQEGSDPVVGLWVAARYPEAPDVLANRGEHRIRISQPISTDPAVPAEQVREQLKLNVPGKEYAHLDSVLAGDFSRFHLNFDCVNQEFDCNLFLLTNGVKSESDQNNPDSYRLRDHDDLEVIVMLRGGLWAQFTDYHEGKSEEGSNSWLVSRDPAQFVVPPDRRHESQLATASIFNGALRGDVVSFDSHTGHHVAMADGVPSFGLHLSFPQSRTVSSAIRTGTLQNLKIA